MPVMLAKSTATKTGSNEDGMDGVNAIIRNHHEAASRSPGLHEHICSSGCPGRLLMVRTYIIYALFLVLLVVLTFLCQG
jgi:hypothetical protein